MQSRPGPGSRLRSWARRNQPAIALLLLAPSIPELLTGSTPVSEIVYNPFGFVIGFSLDIALYGTGALLIREVTVILQKGWGSILLFGAAYGIAEEGFEVHTFFQRSGTPVDSLGSYGHLYGVNWLWALSLTVFHATYSIALPILLTRLWFPETKDQRWFGRRGIGLLGTVFVVEVVGFGGFVVGHGPTPAALTFFIALVALLVTLGVWVPKDLLWPVAGPRRIGTVTLAFLGAVEFLVYFVVLVVSGPQPIPAVAAAAFLVLADGAVLVILLRRVGTENLERSEFIFAVGMLSALFVWDGLIELILVPGILVVTALFIYLLYRLNRTLRSREPSFEVPRGAAGLPPAGP